MTRIGLDATASRDKPFEGLCRHQYAEGYCTARADLEDERKLCQVHGAKLPPELQQQLARARGEA